MPRSRTRTSLAIAAGLVATLGVGLAGALGACSDPFSSDGYGAGDGGGGGTGDATTLPPGAEAGLTDGKASAGDSGIGVTAVDGITDTVCTPSSCAAQNIQCGDASDGCGRQLDCGGCHHYGDVCTNGQCGCTPLDASASCGTLCGLVPDGCAGFYECDMCQGTGVYCGPANTCVNGTTCPGNPDYQNECGTISDGCGSTRVITAACPDTNVNNGCNNGSIPYSCQCNPSSCAQQGYTCSAPGAPAVGDLCQNPDYTCDPCTYPPGQCGTNHLCTGCTRVPKDAGFPWDTQCEETALDEAWACDCVDGGTCVVPDGVKATPATCQQLTNTSAHAIYCCKPQD